MAPTAEESSYPISYDDFNTTPPGPNSTMEPVEIPEIETPKEHEYKLFRQKELANLKSDFDLFLEETKKLSNKI